MTMVSPDDGRPSISRTTRYKKITKPLLERKRRARINRCLDELKDLMVGAFEMEGDNISKLEKADILELTVRHLTKLHSPKDPIADAKRFQAGFGQCAAEACQFILSMPEIDKQISQNLVRHLTSQISEMPLSVQVPPRQTFSPPISPSARSSWSGSSGRDYPRNPHHSSQQGSPVEVVPINKNSPYVPLMCDTMSSTPSVQDLSKPMTGLLMTVDNNPSQSQYNNAYAHEYKNTVGNAEAKKKYDAEVKHVIMKKIRDQILGRQTKEHEIRENVLPITYEQSHNERHYQRPNTTYKNPYTTEYGQNESIDLRKKSKAEYKHYSPRLIEDVPAKQSQICYEQSIPQNVIKYNPSQQEHYASEQSEETYNMKKRTADYRNIHPKKVLIRPISDMQVTSSVKQDQYKRQQFHNVDNGGTSSQKFYEYRYSHANNGTASMSNMRPENSDSDQEDNMWRPW